MIRRPKPGVLRCVRYVSHHSQVFMCLPPFKWESREIYYGRNHLWQLIATKQTRLNNIHLKRHRRFLTGHSACLSWEKRFRKEAEIEQVFADFTALNAVLCQTLVIQPFVKPQIVIASYAKGPFTNTWKATAPKQTVCFSWPCYKWCPWEWSCFGVIHSSSSSLKASEELSIRDQFCTGIFRRTTNWTYY